MIGRYHTPLLLATLLACLVWGPPSVAAEGKATDTESSEAETIVYYFHGNVRCKTCRTIEAWSEEAIKEGFADELAAGTLQWRVVNVDEEENKHFVKDYELVTRSLVLVDAGDGARWKNLPKVWQLVRDKEKFLEYVRKETRQFSEKD